MKKIFLLLVLFLMFGVSAFAAAPTCTSFSFTASTVGASLIQYQCSDSDGDALTFATASGPSHGTITGLNTSTGYFVYTPSSGYTGSDTITFHVTANAQTSSDATLSITVTNQKTRIVDTLTDPSGAARNGKVTFILTQKVNSPAGIIPVSSTVTGVLNGSGQFDVSVYPSASLSPASYYQVWFESSTGQRELIGVYNIPATSSASISLAPNQVTNTNLAAQYTFISQAALNSILSNSGVSTFEGRSGSVTSTSGDYTASEVTNVAAGNIAATNVQSAINELDTEKLADSGSNGILSRTSSGTTTARTLTGTSNRITVTNGNGVSGNPTFDIGSDVVTSGSSSSLNRLTLSGSSTTAVPPSLGASSSTRFILYDSGLSDGEYLGAGVESGALWFNNVAAGKYNFYFGAVKKFDFSGTAFTPTTDNAYDFGGASNRVRHLYLSGAINVGSDATGDIYYRNGSGIFTRLGIGSSGQCLNVTSGIPAWGPCGLSSRVSTQFDKSGNTTLADVTGLSVTVVAGRTYSFVATLYIDADAAGGEKVAIGGTATATSIIYQINSIEDATGASAIASRKTALAGSSTASGSTGYFTKIEGTITVNAGGTLTVQFAQKTSTGTSSVLVGSTFVARDIN